MNKKVFKEAVTNALLEMKWRQDLMTMIYDVAITKKMLGSDLIDKIVEHEHQAILSAEDNMRKRCVEALPSKKGIEGRFSMCESCLSEIDEGSCQCDGFNSALDQATQNINNLDKEYEKNK